MTDSIRKTLLPVFLLGCVLGVTMLEYPPGRIRVRPTAIYMFLLWILLAFLNWYTLFKSPQFADLLNTMATLVSLITLVTVTVSYLMNFHNRQNHAKCIEALTIADDTLEGLGVPRDFRKVRGAVYKLISWLIFTVVCLSAFHLMWSVQEEFDPLYYWARFVINLYCHVGSIVDLQFYILMSCLAVRFDHLGNLLQRLAENEEQRGKPIGKCIVRVTNRDRSRKLGTERTSSVFWVIMHLHQHLCRIVRQVNEMYQFQLCCETASFFIIIVDCTTFMYARLLQNKKLFTQWFYFICISTWVGYTVVKLFLINLISERVTRKANRSKSLADKLNNSVYELEIRLDITQFIYQLIQRPCRITGMRLFFFGYDFLRNFFAYLSTILIVMLQMNLFAKYYASEETEVTDVTENGTIVATTSGHFY